jgi:hypothetical protein
VVDSAFYSMLLAAALIAKLVCCGLETCLDLVLLRTEDTCSWCMQAAESVKKDALYLGSGCGGANLLFQEGRRSNVVRLVAGICGWWRLGKGTVA